MGRGLLKGYYRGGGVYIPGVGYHHFIGRGIQGLRRGRGGRSVQAMEDKSRGNAEYGQRTRIM
eukprot:752888-Hanusia_phi.AAC.1